MSSQKTMEQIGLAKAAMGKPYPTETGKPVEETCNDHLSNFFRNGPNRKVFVLHEAEGDYEYDEEMSIDVEIKMEGESDTIFKSAETMLMTHLGAPLDVPPYSDFAFDASEQELVRDGQRFDNIDWTPEFEGGAIFENADTLDTRCWNLANEYLVLQKGKWTGDGNFALFVVITITRK